MANVKLLLCVNIIILSIVANVFGQEGLNSGLYFASAEVVQDKRTSLNLTPEEPINLTDGFKLDFDIQLRLGDGFYGYVFRVISDSKENFDFIVNYPSEDNNFSLIFKDKILCSFRRNDIPNFEYNSWFHVSFELNLSKQLVELTIDDIKRSANIGSDEIGESFDLLFGISKYEHFQSTDVCPMTLKNVQIHDHSGELVRNWLLSKHTNNKTYDEVDGSVAIVDNPKWLIDAHLSWEELTQFNLDAFYGVVADSDAEKLYFVNENNIIQYSIVSNEMDTIPYLGGSPFRQSNEKHVVFNPYTNEIWSYNLDDMGITKFSFATQKWSNDPKQQNESNFGHHNKLISPIDSTLVAILGYGLYRYNSSVFNYKPEGDSWTRYDRNDQIEPRYLAASGLLNEDTLLVFGGYGSKTGRQELTPRTYSDLYAFDLKKLEFKKLQDYNLTESPFVPAENLVVDDDSANFFTLIFDNSKYKSHIRLAKFGIYDPTHFVYPDSIVFDFLDTDSWAYLYLNKSVHKLFAVTSNKSKVNIYSMAYPPLVQDDVFQEIKIKNKPQNKSVIFILIGGVLVVAVISFVWFRLRVKKKPDVSSPVPVFNEQLFKKVEQIKKSSILFLGGFQIYNEASVDITSDFSPTMKQLFLLIFFSTIHQGKGISSKKLDETLWFDKSEKSARNNRNVNISKLRNAIEEIGGMEIVYENSYWKLKMSSNIYCDYLHVLNITNKENLEELEVNDIAGLLGLLDKGELLPNLREDWIDNYKAQYTNSVIDFLVKLFSRSEVKTNTKTLVQIADSIFALDSLNEDALIVKCQALHKEGKGSVALNVYNSFCKEYKTLLNEEYQATFKDVLEGEQLFK